jgi:nucleotide-binding universal stress UspA family protein
MIFLVAFSSPKRSAHTLDVAAEHAKALHAELFLLRVIPDPKRVGVVAELIASDRPMEKAKSQIDAALASLKEQGIKATGEVRVGRVARTIIGVAEEIMADIIFIGSIDHANFPFYIMPKDPIVHYLVENCPISICLVKAKPENPYVLGTG